MERIETYDFTYDRESRVWCAGSERDGIGLYIDEKGWWCVNLVIDDNVQCQKLWRIVPDQDEFEEAVRRYYQAREAVNAS